MVAEIVISANFSDSSSRILAGTTEDSLEETSLVVSDVRSLPITAVKALGGTMLVTVDARAVALARRYGATAIADDAHDGHTGAVNAGANSTLTVRRLPGGIDLTNGTTSGSADYDGFDSANGLPPTSAAAPYEMYYQAGYVGGAAPYTWLKLYNTPLVAPIVKKCGLDPGARLYGLDYCPSPVTTGGAESATKSRRFSLDRPISMPMYAPEMSVPSPETVAPEMRGRTSIDWATIMSWLRYLKTISGSPTGKPSS